MMNRSRSGARCRTMRNVITAKGLLPQGISGIVHYEMTTGRRLVYVDWDNGMSVAVPPREITVLKQSVEGKVLPRNGSVNSGNAQQLADHTQQARARQNGISLRTQRKLDRLARDFPELYARVRSGKLSVHRASQMAGFVKKETPLDIIKRVWVKAKGEEREEVLRMVLEWKEQKVTETFAVSPGRALSPHPSRLGAGGIGASDRDLSA